MAASTMLASSGAGDVTMSAIPAYTLDRTAMDRTALSASGGDATRGGSSVNSALKLALQFFLEPSHYRKLNRVLGERWKDSHSLTAAVRLMEAHGVDIGKDPDNPDGLPQWLTSLDENRAIEALVARMPQKSPEQFEHFFLQLSFIASTTQRIRNALESGEPELVEEAMESADNVGVLPYLLKMSVSQAGQEVMTMTDDHAQWLADTEAQLSPLLTISAEGMAVQKELTQQKAEMSLRSGRLRGIRCRVVEKMCDEDDIAVVGGVLHGWAENTKRMKREAEIKTGYQVEIDAANKKLFEYQKEQMVKVKSVLSKQSKAHMDAKMQQVIAALRMEEAHIKQQQSSKAEDAALDEAMKKFSVRTKANAMNAITSMLAYTDGGCLALAIQGFRLLIESAKQERELEVRVNEQKTKFANYSKKQKEGAKSALDHFAGESDLALLEQVFNGFKEQCKNDKMEGTAQKAMAQKSSMMKGFNTKAKMGSMSAGERIAKLQEEQTLIFIFSHWKMQTKVERTIRLGREKNEKRKKELMGVKGLFKDFACELETNLSKGTPRVDDLKPRRRASPERGAGLMDSAAASEETRTRGAPAAIPES
mmetsp:Transcript_43962/g.140898  ORF Transcript_43962/g.140898 Transcript_43962/m.140898 type:complete len:593 (+) Transcript_43962:143-1921(+)